MKREGPRKEEMQTEGLSSHTLKHKHTDNIPWHAECRTVGSTADTAGSVSPPDALSSAAHVDAVYDDVRA